MNRKHLYVTVYHEEQRYGGPEEGGWWYDWTEVDKSWLIARDKRRNFKKILRMAKEYAEFWTDGDYYSVNSTGRYFVVVEHIKGSKASKERPYYC